MAMTTSPEEYSMGNEVIRSFIDTIKGGVMLDTTGYTEEYIKAGHIIIKKTEEGKDIYQPMPVSGEAYDSLPVGCDYVGVNIHTVPTDEPFVAVLTIGEVNDKLVPFSMDSIMSDFKAAVPTINWAHD
jgi:hypothetical protein